MRWTCFRFFGVLLAACVMLGTPGVVLPGCTTAPAGTPVVDEEEAARPQVPKSMRVVSSFGGVHRKTEVIGGVWFQSFENRLLALDAQSGTVLADLELAPRGTTGPVSDFVMLGSTIYVVLEDDRVVPVDASVVRAPRIVAWWGRPELGIRPHHVAIVNGEAMVSGDGGVLRLAEASAHGTTFDEDGEPLPPTPPEASLAGKMVGPVIAAEGGPVACIGRRIVRIADGTYVGAANTLIAIPEEWGGGYGFRLQASEGAQVGLMGPDFRERSSSGVKGEVHAIRFFDDRFFAVNDFEVATWKLEKTAGSDTTTAPGLHKDAFVLGALISVPVKGARDVGKVQRNRFAIAGSFGRALYRYLPEGDKPGDTFYWSERLPGKIDVCVSDRRRILGASREGSWMYLIGEKAELSTKPIASPDRPSFAVEASWGTAKASEMRDEVSFVMGDRAQNYTPAGGGRISTLAIADGKVWIGHSRGIDVIGFDPVTQEVVAEDRIRLEGPILGLYPNRVGGGVAYVAQSAGFGVIRPIAEDLPPIVTPGCVDGAPPKENKESDTKNDSRTSKSLSAAGSASAR